MAKGFKVSKKSLMIGFVVLVFIGAVMMYGIKEGFQGNGVTGAISGAGNMTKKVVGETVGLAAKGVEGVARVADVAANAVAHGAHTFGDNARKFGNTSGSSMIGINRHM